MIICCVIFVIVAIVVSLVIVGTGVFQTCSEPRSTQFVTSVCVKGFGYTDTILSECSSPNGSQFTSKTCSNGDSATIGSDAIMENCSVPKSGSFVIKTCVSGDANTEGSDAFSLTCSSPPKDFVSSGMYINSLCYSGDVHSLGHDLTVTHCSIPVPDYQYTQSVCQAGSESSVGSNSIILNCSSRGSFAFLDDLLSKCVSGSYDVLGKDDVINPSMTKIALFSVGNLVVIIIIAYIFITKSKRRNYMLYSTTNPISDPTLPPTTVIVDSSDNTLSNPSAPPLPCISIVYSPPSYHDAVAMNRTRKENINHDQISIPSVSSLIQPKLYNAIYNPVNIVIRDECCVCFEEFETTKSKKIVFIPCLHVDCCEECYKKLTHKVCPICRALVEDYDVL